MLSELFRSLQETEISLDEAKILEAAAHDFGEAHHWRAGMSSQSICGGNIAVPLTDHEGNFTDLSFHAKYDVKKQYIIAGDRVITDGEYEIRRHEDGDHEGHVLASGNFARFSRGGSAARTIVSTAREAIFGEK